MGKFAKGHFQRIQVCLYENEKYAEHYSSQTLHFQFQYREVGPSISLYLSHKPLIRGKYCEYSVAYNAIHPGIWKKRVQKIFSF